VLDKASSKNAAERKKRVRELLVVVLVALNINHPVLSHQGVAVVTIFKSRKGSTGTLRLNVMELIASEDVSEVVTFLPHDPLFFFFWDFLNFGHPDTLFSFFPSSFYF
jgi:hypothetical protein